MTTILLIEDNDVIRNNTAEILTLTGYAVLTAENGRVGIETALENRPDLVICDIMMPVLDGYAVLHIFNKKPQLSGIPFIFLSAKNEPGDFRKGMDLGADDYLTKPFEVSDLLNAIEGRLNRFRHIDLPEMETIAQVDSRPKSDYDLRQDGLGQFLDDALRLGNKLILSADRKTHVLRKKQYIYSEGDLPTRLYFLKAGKVKTIRTTSDGKELITGLYNPGDFFGYFALLQQSDQADSAVVLDDAELIYIPQDDFMQLLLANPVVSSQFIRLLAGQVGDRETQLLGMAYDTLRRRVADTLLRLYSLQPHALIQLARDDLAAMIGTATESLIRTLSEFRRDGLLEMTESGGIRVMEPENLRRATR
ncbi:response regulator [Spirosoma validum]|uniref:Response regulator n=1 Tax=Spirosoma validum TaxID=2771355 RepID=A0A927GGA9_9BACT|nr:response regulator [Spirosoma validum]MBD2756518.1 response regulator [Spirosoma validum]